ncbi:MAG: cation:proton antiporter [Chromatiaceae bacterium]|nr:cation:proton antiporter [Chromatiaceae bacterium]
MTDTHYIVDVLILLAAAVIFVPLFQRIGLGAVLGFLVGGALVGPWGLGFIVAVEEIRHLAEFGVIFLLFIIGIELKPSRLWIMRRSVFGLGSAQLLLTGTLITLAVMLLAVPIRPALIIGFGLALSSTAFGLQILSDKGELGSGYGRTAFAILLLQDLAIVPMMALLPLLAAAELTIAQDIELAALESLAIIAGVFVLGRLLLRPLLQLVAGSQRNPEIFTATAILLVLGASWLTGWAGLSMALGAFLGGLLLADSHYRHQLMADIQPFRGLLLGLFFMSVGMSINFGFLATQGVLVAQLVLALLLIKVVVVWALCSITGRTFAESINAALLLAQAGEFGFVMFGLASMAGILEKELYQLLLLVIALSMAATPLLVKLGPWLGRILSSTPDKVLPPVKSIPGAHDHVIIAGFGRFGGALARGMAQARVPYLVLDVDPVRVARAQALDYPVYYGDARQMEVLRSAGAEEARLVVFAMNQMESIGQAVVSVREAFPSLRIYARARDERMAEKLLSLGVVYAIPETLEASKRFTRDVLRGAGIASEVVERVVAGQPRQGDFGTKSRHRAEEERRLYQQILLVLTPGADEPALINYAAALAVDNRAGLTVAEILAESATSNEEGISSPDELEEQMTEERRGRLEKLTLAVRAGVSISTKVLVGRVHEQIIREVVSGGHDLVLKPAEGSKRLKQRLFGDNDTRLMKDSPCPVLLIRTIPSPPYRHRRICAALYQDEKPGGQRDDRKLINRRILEHAGWLANVQFAEFHVIHAWEAYGEQDLQSGFSPFQFDAENYVAQEQKRNREALETMLAQLRESRNTAMAPVFNPVCHMIKGSHRDAIISKAIELEADLVVVGSEKSSGITSLIVDSTATTIARQLSCSVMMVKPADAVADDVGLD